MLHLKCVWNKILSNYLLIDNFSDLKNFDIGEETKIYVNSLIERSKISINAKFHGEI